MVVGTGGTADRTGPVVVGAGGTTGGTGLVTVGAGGTTSGTGPVVVGAGGTPGGTGCRFVGVDRPVVVAVGVRAGELEGFCSGFREGTGLNDGRDRIPERDGVG
ncbi:hypothetical protein [Streptomyces adustus]|uniref:hypothetical protein n=1 Tax=Streptomyces adustus TaxID=1609272 RepID=UPI0037219347